MHRENPAIPFTDRNFSFGATVSTPNSRSHHVIMPSLVLYLEDGSSQTAELLSTLVTIGRSGDSDLALTCPSVSTHHATLKQREDGWYVQDAGSSNGTRVNGVQVEEALLNEGDRLAFGDIQAIFYVGAPPPQEEEAPEDAEFSEESPSSLPPPEGVPLPPPAADLPSTPPPPPLRRSASPLGAAGRPVPRRVKRSVEDTDSGCMSAIGILLLLCAAIFTGLWLRHHRETGGNLFGDLFNRLTGGLPQIKIEKRVNE